MDTSQSYKIANLYPFVKAEFDRFAPEQMEKRLWEFELMKKQRNAVSFCKVANGVNHSDLSKLTNDEKTQLETCLKDNFLSKDRNYFGKRDVIYLDLHNYE